MTAMNGFQGISRLRAVLFRQTRTRRPWARKARPTVEGLESLRLLSGMTGPAAMVPAPAAQVQAKATPAPAPAVITLQQTQTVKVASALTNFTLPFSPAVQLFNPALGTLVEVDVVSSVNISSLIKAQNTSTTSGTTITATVTGDYTVGGLSAPVAGSVSATDSRDVAAFPGGAVDFTGPSSALFPSVGKTDVKTLKLTDAASLAFYTASAGRTSVTPTLASNANATADAPNGNLQSQVTSFSSGVVTLVFKYTAPCPTITKVVRFGIHNQPTQLAVTFSQAVNPADATNVNNYKVLTQAPNGTFGPPGGQVITVKSAVYNTATRTVLLTMTQPFNYHKPAKLVVTLPGCPAPISVIIGGPGTLGGYTAPKK
ncbi:MAG: choice-of-anchor E domain-containing protein [Isosphaeraceae bacterium]